MVYIVINNRSQNVNSMHRAGLLLKAKLIIASKEKISIAVKDTMFENFGHNRTNQYTTIIIDGNRLGVYINIYF